MCVYSMVMDQGLKWPQEYWKQPAVPVIFTTMLKSAQQYDIKNNEPDCELESKKDLLRKLADEFGIVIDFPENFSATGTGEMKNG